VVAALLLACGPMGSESTPDAKAALETEEQKTIYAAGLALAQTLGKLPLTEEELALLQEGLGDALTGREPRVDLNAYRTQIQALRTDRLSGEQRAIGAAYVVKALEQPGAVQTESGLVITELVAGDGPSPTAQSSLQVHYHGTLVDGTVFDSSVDRGNPVTMPLTRVIPCWTEGLQRMKVGGKSRLVCPPEIAYGDRGAPPLIQPGATLVFEVELLSIVE
jgi:FKBP-type peptidyl-prolyl cis-trans isomerase FkpA/FKBP-type peptidyl-prolyl cis-trans isomerase FklB